MSNSFNLWQCTRCADMPEFEGGTAFATHMREVHGDTDTTVARRMSCHMDARDWHQTDYNIYKDDVLIARHSVRVARRGEDRDIWNDDQPKKRGRR